MLQILIGGAGANNDGEITIKAPGSITITATKAADANYNKVTATFELLVVTVVIPDGAVARDVKSEDDEDDVAAAADETGEALAVDNVGNDDNDLRLFLPALPRPTTLTVGTYDLLAVDTPVAPARVVFSGVTMDIASTAGDLNDSATVCLSTAGVPENRDPLLWHLADPASPWQEIGSDTTTREDFVCGKTTTFSPFAVGYNLPNDLATDLNEQILTRVSQAMTASTLEAVARRVEAVAGGAGGTGTTPALAYQFGGQSSLSGLLKSHGKAMLEDNMEYERLFDGASFVVPLSATAGGNSGGSTLSVWGGSDFRSLGSDYDGLEWDGELVNIHFGVDGLVGEKALAGLALSLGQSSFEYEEIDATIPTKGEYDYNSTNLHPYFGWFPNEELKIWAIAGFGSGEVEITEEMEESAQDMEEETRSTDTAQLSLAGGFSSQLVSSTKQSSGITSTLNLKGDVSITSVVVEENLETRFDEQTVSSSRLRLLLSGDGRRALTSGGMLMPSVEVGVRVDGGDGVTGAGVELGGGLRYANPGGNFTIAGNVRTLLGHDYDESGAGLLLQMLPPGGRGLSLSLHPVWGQAQSATDQLWDADINEIGSGDAALQSSLSTEVGYGVAASMLGTSGVLTPYTGLTTADGETNRVRLGTRFSDRDGLSVDLEGARNNAVNGASHTVLLRGTVEF